MTLALFTRFPRLRARAQSWPVIPPGVDDEFPTLQEDLAVLHEDVTPAYSTYDAEALKEQNSHRLQQVVLLVGSALTSGLGGIQAMVSDQRWPGILLGGLGFVLGVFGIWVKRHGALDRYLHARLRAERLRALHFRYLARSGSYSGDSRRDALREAVSAIGEGRESG